MIIEETNATLNEILQLRFDIFREYGKLTKDDREDFIRTNVMRKSVLVNNKVQTPEVKVSPVFEYTWQDMRFTQNKNFSSTR